MKPAPCSARRPHRQIGQVGQVADAPRLLGAHAVQLGRPAPRSGRHPAAPAAPRRRARRSARCRRPATRPARAVGDSRAAGPRAVRTSPRRSSARRGRRAAGCSPAAADPRAAVPSSSRIHTSTGSPWVTCTQNGAGRSARTTTVGGSVCSQCARSWARSAAALSSSVSAGTPRASSTASRVDSGTDTVAARPVDVVRGDAVAVRELDQ